MADESIYAKEVETELLKELPRLKAVTPKADTSESSSAAQQIFNMAETIKMLHRELDAMEQDFTATLNKLRAILGGKG